ncbi:uncharacterized protein [Halyomorpha halys]|uniref:uncharacterized protein n=1 Tax=Halyomorpha halys TaxID=286706 RepID=UPI0006D500D3|nr:uncharacterized protein LOC106679276 [Halyomorpha halys]
MSVLTRAIEKCGRLSELGTCLRMRAVTLLDRALKSGPLVINDYISLAPVAAPNGTQPSPQEIEASLPQDPQKKDSALDDIIADKLTQFVSSRSLRFTIPPPTELGEGRKKGGYGGGGGDKKGGGMIMMAAVAMGGMMMQMAMAKIALLAGKALLVGKMALLLSAIIGLKKLVGGGGGGGESHQVVYATEAHGGGHGWGRSAHDLAYSAQARANQARK